MSGSKGGPVSTCRTRLKFQGGKVLKALGLSRKKLLMSHDRFASESRASPLGASSRSAKAVRYPRMVEGWRPLSLNK